MQEIAFPGFKFQKFSGDYPSNKYMYNDKLQLIFNFFLLFVHFFLYLFQMQVELA
jgi:hypothetical protein